MHPVHVCYRNVFGTLLWVCCIFVFGIMLNVNQDYELVDYSNFILEMDTDNIYGNHTNVTRMPQTEHSYGNHAKVTRMSAVGYSQFVGYGSKHTAGNYAFHSPSISSRRPVGTSHRDGDIKVILLWNTFYQKLGFGVGALGRRAFPSRRCPENRCRLETDRSLLNRSAAVVFHMRNRVKPFPVHANARQLFVYFLRESPQHTYGATRRYRTRFNVTMTYRQDSDIPIPIARFVPVTPAKETPYKLKYPLATRTGTVAWMVSHCGTPSKRSKYTSALAKYIDIEIYGACGKFKCGREQHCMSKFERKYKFYLSFENSYCQDYVTEKYYRTLQFELIPIVYGRANYTSLGPPRAFINILDYRSPRHLARYLHYLANNETAYLEYFQTRPYWKPAKNVLGSAFCTLCDIVHRPSYTRVYKDIHAWWKNGTCDMGTVKRLIESTKLNRL